MMKIGLFGEKDQICAGSRTNLKPYTGQITEIAPYVRTYLWDSILYKYHGVKGAEDIVRHKPFFSVEAAHFSPARVCYYSLHIICKFANVSFGFVLFYRAVDSDPVSGKA